MKADSTDTQPVKPRAYLISRPDFDIEAFRSFLRAEGTQWHRTSEATRAEEIVEASGRICYMSFGRKQSARDNAEYIHNLILQGHESVLEHVNWTFLLTGISRAFTHQLVRHRVGLAFSQLSQQYHEETDATFVEPAHLHSSPRALEVWRNAIATAHEAYKTILDSLSGLGSNLDADLVKKELNRAVRAAARSILPNATETKIIVTANARALRHIFKVRGSIPGDTEMREVMAIIFRLVQPEAPALFADFHLEELADGTSVLIHQETPDHSSVHV